MAICDISNRKLIYKLRHQSHFETENAKELKENPMGREAEAGLVENQQDFLVAGAGGMIGR